MQEVKKNTKWNSLPKWEKRSAKVFKKHSDLSKACQNLPNYLPKPCPNPSQTDPECLQNPIFYRNYCISENIGKKSRKMTQNLSKTRPKPTPNEVQIHEISRSKKTSLSQTFFLRFSWIFGFKILDFSDPFSMHFSIEH